MYCDIQVGNIDIQASDAKSRRPRSDATCDLRHFFGPSAAPKGTAKNGTRKCTLCW
jgi:hypothetical protein